MTKYIRLTSSHIIAQSRFKLRGFYDDSFSISLLKVVFSPLFCRFNKTYTRWFSLYMTLTRARVETLSCLAENGWKSPTSRETHSLRRIEWFKGESLMWFNGENWLIEWKCNHIALQNHKVQLIERKIDIFLQSLFCYFSLVCLSLTQFSLTYRFSSLQFWFKSNSSESDDSCIVVVPT